MTRKRSRSRSKLRFPKLLLFVFTLFSGSGLGGYFNPEWPVVGPLVSRLTDWKEQHPDANLTEAGLRSTVADGVERAKQYAKDQVSQVANRNQYGNNVVPAQYAAQDRYAAESRQGSSANRATDKLLIATYNIQVFGKSKMSKPAVVETLVKIVRLFDLVAIQEIRAQDDDILPTFINSLNADGSQYDFIISPRLGRTVSTEQYAFIFDRTRVEYDPNAVGTMSDPSDMLHREPFVARFRARTASPQHAFTFWMVNTHTDPDEVPDEVAALAEVFEVMQQARQDEDDVILLGDLNANENQMGRLGGLPNMGWVVRGITTNTRRTKAYDNILFNTRATTEYTGRWGVFDIERAFGLTPEQALDVSDHFPVWAEYSVWESGPRPGPY
ncbi:Endonuclease/Exonuclease/phosphatase family protein [Novipirellula aureliae]|uniref:Endonuclease/Exonuclease/phosphatase family protein n=1 Tax=Novipirellula aureliae TaxID=2527966 RepID=A0A5C6E899_9BACT|nr:endonuclease/exonuclease/phosphatase family protein [Novipirellula aureliae]TWU45060.1 Endonuclease/Exonuclease/phosphatase family protein [Novipirellula aureliae]